MLVTHVSEGLGERADQGLHSGGILFGYQSCRAKEDGEWGFACATEHSGGHEFVLTYIELYWVSLDRLGNKRRP